jgi:hypothetical protein
VSLAASFTLPEETKPITPTRAVFNLFLVSVLILFLELACIRWFPAHVLFLTFFTNVVLLACFLGMSLGCLAAGHRWNYLLWTPILLLIGMAVAHEVERTRTHGLRHFLRPIVSEIVGHEVRGVQVDVGHQVAPQLVFFGTESRDEAPDRFIIPIEGLAGFYFVLIALAMIGPGQVLGRAFTHVPNRVVAYSVNIFGSLVGIVLFSACSWYELPPFWWFALPVVVLGYFLLPGRFVFWALVGLAPVAALWQASLNSGPYVPEGQLIAEHLWSPYYRVDYDHADMDGSLRRFITVNLIGHQAMRSHNDPFPAYALPHLLNRDTGGPPFKNVLIIGAGSGNDVSRALQWGAEHVDAVEIDPVIWRLGYRYHPDRPYHDPRVERHIDDGRNFLRQTDRKYDLIVYALLDSLVLHSSHSNIRLESYLFTDQAFRDIRAHLNPGGLFVTYNYFRQGWVVARLHNGIRTAFDSEPLVLTYPFEERIDPDENLYRYNTFTLIFAGDRTDDLRRGLQPQQGRSRLYWLRETVAPSPESPDGFRPDVRGLLWTFAAMPGAGLAGVPWAGLEDVSDWQYFGQAEVVPPTETLRPATDDWPFLYLHQPMIPDLALSGMAIMGGLALVLLIVFLPRPKQAGGRFAFSPAMFFLGAGFMLIETKAVVQMALLFGSTWIVNSIVFFAVLVMILLANLFVLVVRPGRLWPYYAGLLATLALNAIVPLNFFLGMDRTVQVVGSCALVFTPVLFAGVIFAVLFSRTAEPDRALGANIAGAMVGGLAEYTSMLIGFQYVVLVAIVFYALSMLGARRPAIPAAAEPRLIREPVPEGV